MIITTVGDIGDAVNGLACDLTTNIMYGVTTTDTGANPGCLIVVNRSSGAGTVIGPLGGGLTTMDDIAFSSGTLFGINYSTASLYTIDLLTGAATQFGSEVFVDTGSGVSAAIFFHRTTGYLHVFFGEAVYRVDPATGMIDEPNYTTNVSFPTVAADQDLDGRVYGAYDLNADGSDTHFLHWTVWYDPGGSTVDTGYEGEMGDSVDALCFTPGVFYQRIYGIPVEIDDNGTETVRELLVGVVGAP